VLDLHGKPIAGAELDVWQAAADGFGNSGWAYDRGLMLSMLDDEESLAEALRLGEPPVIAVVRDGRTLLDCRTLSDPDVDQVAAAVRAAR